MADDVDGAGEGSRTPLQIVGLVLIVVVVAAISWFIVRRILDDDDETVAPAEAAVSVEATGGSAATAGSEPSSTPEATDGDETTTTAEEPATTDAGTSEPPTTEPTTTQAETTAPVTTSSATTAPAAPGTSAPDVGYDTLPDGSPVPVVATFDGNVVTLSGAVPSQAAADRLAGLAQANAQDPASASVVNNLTINPNVPISVGVRVLELQSPRFPEESAEVLPEHAVALNRVVNVMNLLPNVSVIVVGHADQRGETEANRALSEERARSVASYIASQGIDPARLASRGVGEADLLSINDDAAALALNRRTEFIFSGLLVP